MLRESIPGILLKRFIWLSLFQLFPFVYVPYFLCPVRSAYSTVFGGEQLWVIDIAIFG